jgi:hypothetical protein
MRFSVRLRGGTADESVGTFLTPARDPAHCIRLAETIRSVWVSNRGQKSPLGPSLQGLVKFLQSCTACVAPLDSQRLFVSKFGQKAPRYRT